MQIPPMKINMDKVNSNILDSPLRIYMV